MRVVQERFRGNASYIETGTTKGATLFNTGNLKNRRLLIHRIAISRFSIDDLTFMPS